jgi:tRNA threonylcarbamoyladenosine modification (KEOPS) complex Cgi121 subunit
MRNENKERVGRRLHFQLLLFKSHLDEHLDSDPGVLTGDEQVHAKKVINSCIDIALGLFDHVAVTHVDKAASDAMRAWLKGRDVGRILNGEIRRKMTPEQFMEAAYPPSKE